MPRKRNPIALPRLPYVKGWRKLKPPEVPHIPPPRPQEKEVEDRWRAWQQEPNRPGTASILEFLTWEFLEKKKKQIPGVDFIFQYPLLGGRTQFGGFVADFYLPARQEVWNPAGLHFHWTVTKHRARDKMAEVVLASKGIRLIYLWEDDLINRPDYTLEAAWRGSQLPGRI